MSTTTTRWNSSPGIAFRSPAARTRAFARIVSRCLSESPLVTQPHSSEMHCVPVRNKCSEHALLGSGGVPAASSLRVHRIRARIELPYATWPDLRSIHTRPDDSLPFARPSWQRISVPKRRVYQQSRSGRSRPVPECTFIHRLCLGARGLWNWTGRDGRRDDE